MWTDSKQDYLVSDEMQNAPSKPGASVVGLGLMLQDVQRWCWGRFVEVIYDDGVLGFEVDLHEEKDQEHCSIHAAEEQEFLNEHN